MDTAIQLTADRGDSGDTMSKNIYFRAWTEPDARGDGFIAFWVAPGLHPAIVRDDNRIPMTFKNRASGELTAWRRMAETLNRPRSKATKDKPERYERLTGPEFAALLQETNITPTFLAYLYGTSQKRALNWLDGVPNEDVPHPIRVLLELFKADERNIDIAENVTDAVTSEKNPRANTG